jgi:UDP-N-acetylmuramate: L-alanyl-gamma-D-glutamyl-meso-diaminopimelate ligase
LPVHSIHNGKTTITIEDVTKEIKVFGNHNLLNLNAAYFVCKELGIAANDFVNAISNFTGAAKRLELLANNETTNVYRDFAHAPSKVIATINAVKQQYPDSKLIAILELHTFSSLNENFMTEYKGAMDKADVAVVFYSKHALELKRMPLLPKEKVMEGFAKEGLLVMNDKETLNNFLHEQDYTNTNLLLMSSGNYDGLDMIAFAKEIINQ